MHELNEPGRAATAAAVDGITAHSARPSHRRSLTIRPGSPSILWCLKGRFVENISNISGFIQRVFSMNETATL
jgi:hypothetical protein